MTVIHNPPFGFDHLFDVQPLLVTAPGETMSLTIDSIERHSQGFVLVLWVTTPTGPTQLLAISAQDDDGRGYNVRRLRYAAPRTPAIDPEDVLGGPWQFDFDLTGHQHRLATAQSPASTPSSSQPPPGGPSMSQIVASRSESGIRPPHLSPSTLTRVIPVAQRQEAAGPGVTLLSLESYVDGFSWWLGPISPNRSSALPPT